jgi:hypothetical protein
MLSCRALLLRCFGVSVWARDAVSAVLGPCKTEARGALELPATEIPAV